MCRRRTPQSPVHTRSAKLHSRSRASNLATLKAGDEYSLFGSGIKVSDQFRLTSARANRRNKPSSCKFFEALLCLFQCLSIGRVKLVFRVASRVHYDVLGHDPLLG